VNKTAAVVQGAEGAEGVIVDGDDLPFPGPVT
jgi:hypothetical protein